MWKNIKAGGLLDWNKKKYSGGSSSSTLNVYVTRPIEKSFSTDIGENKRSSEILKLM